VLYLCRARIGARVGHAHPFGSGATLNYYRKELNRVATGEFFQNTSTGVRIAT
jgi:hypothetical protein